MRAAMGLLSLVFLLPTLVFAQGMPTPDQRPFAFTHVTVIDATGAPAQPDMTVVVSGNRISALGKTGSVTIPKAAQVTDAKGKFMIPGLWDMHQHTFWRKSAILPLYVMWLDLVNGITGVRDMADWGPTDDFGDIPYWQDFIWRQAIAAGSVLGPRLVIAGNLLEGGPLRKNRQDWIEVSTAAQGRAAVDFLKKFGVDFIKVHNNIPREAYFAIADESKKQGIMFAGHVTNTVSVAEASDAGQKTLEHLQGVLVACSTQEQELMKAFQEESSIPPNYLGEPALLHHAKAVLATYSDEKCRALFAKFVKNDTYICPTLIREGTAPHSPTDPHLAYLSPVLRKEVERGASSFKEDPELKPLHAAHYRVVKEMQQAGVKLLVGTDAQVIGYDTHREMAEMVAAGLTPMQVLQAATKTPAEYFGKLDSMGTIEKGKIADLVLLDANPLESIENATKIRSVVVNGRLLDRDALDRMLAQMKIAASGVSQPAVGFGDALK